MNICCPSKHFPAFLASFCPSSLSLLSSHSQLGLRVAKAAALSTDGGRSAGGWGVLVRASPSQSDSSREQQGGQGHVVEEMEVVEEVRTGPADTPFWPFFLWQSTRHHGRLNPSRPRRERPCYDSIIAGEETDTSKG